MASSATSNRRSRTAPVRTVRHRRAPGGRRPTTPTAGRNRAADSAGRPGLLSWGARSAGTTLRLSCPVGIPLANAPITARGSAGCRPGLGAGAPTRHGHNGRALYDESDAATVLGVTKDELARVVGVGTAVVLGRAATFGGRQGPADGPVEGPTTGPAHGPGSTFGPVSGSYLVPVIDSAGSRRVGGGELSRCTVATRTGAHRRANQTGPRPTGSATSSPSAATRASRSPVTPLAQPVGGHRNRALTRCSWLRAAACRSGPGKSVRTRLGQARGNHVGQIERVVGRSSRVPLGLAEHPSLTLPDRFHPQVPLLSVAA